jgi:hypothetical protein
MTERDLQQAVVHVARLYGWRVYHTWTSIHSNAGFPDLVLVRDGRLVVVELKSDRGVLSPAQDAWLADLRQTPVEVYVWRPDVLSNGVALRVLRRRDAKE